MKTNQQSPASLIAKSKEALRDNMLARNMAAIIWDLSSAGFHYLPSITLDDGRVVRVSGLYVYDNELYVIDEDCRRAEMSNFYNPDTEVAPTVVCLTPNVASGDLGVPTPEDGFTQGGSMEEWLVIADCYFEALNES